MDSSADPPRVAMHEPPISVLAQNAALAPNTDYFLVSTLAICLQHEVKDVELAYRNTFRNVRTILRRQILNAAYPTLNHPVCILRGEEQLWKALGTVSLGVALLALARMYDEAHVALCKCISAARKGKAHNEAFRQNPVIDVQPLTDGITRSQNAIDGCIVLDRTCNNSTPLRATWSPVPVMSFDCLPRLSSLAGRLPGEELDSRGYAGIGGGGGSDVISASLLGRLLQLHEKQMNLLVSTRTWATGSQGGKGSKMGIKREVYNHGGQAKAGGKAVSGTFRIRKDTHAEGRDLETIPLAHHRQVYMVLDQGESVSEIPEHDRADLKDQFNAVLAQAERSSTFMIVNTGGDVLGQRHIDTVLSVDTGGDVFGADGSGGTTPDQDLRVQKAISTLPLSRNLVTAVVAPGVDAPRDAPEKALKAGGVVYKPTKDEQKMLLDILAEYRMDGSDPSRFGRTTLALQARLRGILGWTSLDLPEHVIDTWENPWSSFVYIQECMSDIILMPTRELLPVIEPAKQ